MNDNEMYNMIQKAKEMIDNNQIPEELKSAVANMNSSNSSSNAPNFNGTSSSIPNIDADTMMKVKSMMSKMNLNGSDDDMSKLLYALKPYLRNEKKEKVDDYIKLVKMGQMTQFFDMFNNNKN